MEGLPVVLKPFDIAAVWTSAVKRTISRFSRGNIASQYGRIQTEAELQQERESAYEIAEKMRARYSEQSEKGR